MLPRIAAFTLRSAYMRYIGASVVALGADIVFFLAVLRAGLTPTIASAAGYMLGVVVHWLVSSRLVFADGSAARGSRERTGQKALFVGSALVGLAITTGIVGLGSHWGADPRLAKLFAIAIAFQATWLLRRTIVFA